MDRFAAELETLEHQLMRAWMHRDRNGMKALASRDFVFLVGSKRAAILDRPSWLDAATTRLTCEAYRFSEVYVRRHGTIAIFACQVALEATIGTREWRGDVWFTDLWRRSMIGRRWRIVERVAARPDADQALPAAIEAFQLWR